MSAAPKHGLIRSDVLLIESNTLAASIAGLVLTRDACGEDTETREAYQIVLDRLRAAARELRSYLPASTCRDERDAGFRTACLEILGNIEAVASAEQD